jgi:hypothetical protein
MKNSQLLVAKHDLMKHEYSKVFKRKRTRRFVPMHAMNAYWGRGIIAPLTV